jgi:hypothetical protein
MNVTSDTRLWLRTRRNVGIMEFWNVGSVVQKIQGTGKIGLDEKFKMNTIL